MTVTGPLPGRRGRYTPGPPRYDGPDPDGWLLWALVAAAVVAYLARGAS